MTIAWTWLVNGKQIGTNWYDTIAEAADDLNDVISAANALGITIETVKLVSEMV